MGKSQRLGFFHKTDSKCWKENFSQFTLLMMVTRHLVHISGSCAEAAIQKLTALGQALHRDQRTACFKARLTDCCQAGGPLYQDSRD